MAQEVVDVFVPSLEYTTSSVEKLVVPRTANDTEYLRLAVKDVDSVFLTPWLATAPVSTDVEAVPVAT